jgi:hypothetical protein
MLRVITLSNVILLCRHAGYHYARITIFRFIMSSVVILSIIMIGVVMPSVIVLIVMM